MAGAASAVGESPSPTIDPSIKHVTFETTPQIISDSVEQDALSSNKQQIEVDKRPFGKRALPGITPRDIIYVFWDLHGKRSSAVYRKAKVFRYPANNVQQFLRKLVIDERTGEILEDEVANVEILPTEVSAIICNKEGQLLFLKDSSKVHPMMPSGVGSTIKDLVRLLQTSIGGLQGAAFLGAVQHDDLRNLAFLI